MSRTVELRIAGQNYRVVSTASTRELEHLALVVDRKLSEITPQGRRSGAPELLLAAMALAHELEEERRQREALVLRTRELLGSLLGHVDSALGGRGDETGEDFDAARAAGTERSGGEDAQSEGGAPDFASADAAAEGEERFT